MLRWLNRRNTPEEEETKRRRGFFSRPREEARERTCGDSDSEERRRNEPPSWFLLASARREMKRANACDDPRNATGRSLGRHRKKEAAPMEGPRRVDVTRKDSRPTRLIERSKKRCVMPVTRMMSRYAENNPTQPRARAWPADRRAHVAAVRGTLSSVIGRLAVTRSC